MRNAAALVGLLVCLYVLWFMVKDDQRRRGPQVRTRGTIVDFHTARDDGSATYAAVVRFQAGTHRMDFVDDMEGPWRPRVGRSVWVSYPVGQPALARIARPWLRASAYALLVGAATAMLAILAGLLPA